jgi:signal transduction histidine kinase
VATWNLAFIYFVYGLAFFSMGLAVWLEGGRANDPRLRRALQPLIAFGLIHGGHEWLEMFQQLNLLPTDVAAGPAWEVLRLAIVALSLLPLATFGAWLLAFTERLWRLALLTPLFLTVVWGVGSIAITVSGASNDALWPMLNVWTRYSLGIPSALLAAAGLVMQQREFRRAGMSHFGRDALWAAIAFFWYGAVGQVFVGTSALPPSNVVNQGLFLSWFGFPIQLFRAGCAVFQAVFVIRFLRAFEVESQRQIAGLQAARLEEAQRREAQRGELLQRVVAAQESERQRVARELHDATGQSLTALGLGLRSVAPLARQDVDAAERRLSQLETLTTESLDELRHIIADLRPSHLDDLGLAPALRWYAKEVEARSTLHIQVEVAGHERAIDPATRIALFRIAQEAMANAVKHSRAALVRLNLGFLPTEVQLSVEDDGCGFTPGAPIDHGRPTWGILGMRERAALLHGRFDIRSQPNAGTRIEVTIPDATGESAT